MAALLINEEAMARLLREKLNEDMLRAAEPEIKAALERIEKEMRKKLASNLIALLDQQIDMYRDQRRLVITIRGEEP